MMHNIVSRGLPMYVSIFCMYVYIYIYIYMYDFESTHSCIRLFACSLILVLVYAPSHDVGFHIADFL